MKDKGCKSHSVGWALSPSEVVANQERWEAQWCSEPFGFGGWLVLGSCWLGPCLWVLVLVCWCVGFCLVVSFVAFLLVCWVLGLRPLASGPAPRFGALRLPLLRRLRGCAGRGKRRPCGGGGIGGMGGKASAEVSNRCRRPEKGGAPNWRTDPPPEARKAETK